MLAGGPWAIRQLHAGRGPAFLVGVLEGRDVVAVDSYLHVWDHAARSLSVLLVLGTLLAYIAMRLIVAVRRPPTSADRISTVGGVGRGRSRLSV